MTRRARRVVRRARLAPTATPLYVLRNAAKALRVLKWQRAILRASMEY